MIHPKTLSTSAYEAEIVYAFYESLRSKGLPIETATEIASIYFCGAGKE